MTFVPDLVLRNSPGQLRKRLKEAGYLVVTGDGEPFVTMLLVEPSEIEQVLQTIFRLQAQQAVRNMRETARKRGLDRLSEAEVRAAGR